MGADGESLHGDESTASRAVTPTLPPTDDLVGRDRGPHERHPLRIGLSAAADGGPIDPEDWAGHLPQANGISPRVRIGRRWFNLLWLIPLSVGLLIVLVAVAKGLRGMPGVEAFVRRHPGTVANTPRSAIGIPWWSRWQHFFNLFFLMFIVRAGLQILDDTRASTSTATARPDATGSVSRSRCRSIASGRRRRTRCACRAGSASPVYATRSGSRAGGTSSSTCSGSSTASSSSRSSSSPATGGGSSRRRGTSSRTPARSRCSTCR